MKESIYKSYDELPLFLNAGLVAKVLGVSISTGYELMHEQGFLALKIGSRIVVPKESLSHGWSRTREVRVEVQAVPKARPNQKLFSSAQ